MNRFKILIAIRSLILSCLSILSNIKPFDRFEDQSIDEIKNDLNRAKMATNNLMSFYKRKGEK